MLAGGPLSVPEVYTSDSADPQVVAYQQHQHTAARLTPAEEAKKLVGLAKCVPALPDELTINQP